MGLIWDLYQQHGIGDAKVTAESAATLAGRAAGNIKLLERRVERLALACQAMWELLGERAGVSEGELMARMEEVDLRDGAADGKMQAQVLVCPTCKRRVNSRRTVCMYCTNPLPRPHAFE